MAKTRAYKIEFNPDLNTTRISRSGRVCLGFKFMRSNATQILKSDILDTCGVYLLLSDRDEGKRAVYVGEAESVHNRLKQHCAKPIFDWDEAIAFVSVNEDWEKSNIKYMEHGLYSRLHEAKTYQLMNGNVPKQSKVFSPDVSDEQIDEIMELVGYLGHPKLFKKANTNSTIVSKSRLIPNGASSYKAGKLYRAVFTEAFKRRLVDDADMKLFLSLNASKVFKTGGYELFRKDTGGFENLKGSNGIFRYYKDMQFQYGRHKYYLTSQLYAKSIPALLTWLSSKGVTENDVKVIYAKAYPQ